MEIQTERLRLVLQSTEEVLVWLRLWTRSRGQRSHPTGLRVSRPQGQQTPGPTASRWCTESAAPSLGAVPTRDRRGQRDRRDCLRSGLGVPGSGICDGVRLVRAHTRPDGEASMRVLTKCGFEWIGEVVDPEDGLVCRWEIRQEAT